MPLRATRPVADRQPSEPWPIPIGIVDDTVRCTGSIFVTVAVFPFSTQTKPSPTPTSSG